MEKKELSLQLNNINIGDFKMKKTNFAVAGLSLCLLFSSCGRSEEHTSELQSRFDLVCRLLLEKKKN